MRRRIREQFYVQRPISRSTLKVNGYRGSYVSVHNAVDPKQMNQFLKKFVPTFYTKNPQANLI
jgi:hypothetical protein